MVGLGGYAGKILRVNLTNGTFRDEKIDEKILRSSIGGTGLGARFLYDEVEPEVEWSSPENRLFIGQGPLGASPIGGSGSISIVSKGAMTGGAVSTQSNGFFGAYMKMNGYDAIMLEGSSDSLKYVVIDEGGSTLADANWLSMRDTYDTSDLLKHQYGKASKEASVLSIGLAGERMVRFAGIFVDKGHSASHNGVGAVMGSKKLKAILVSKRENAPDFADRQRLLSISRRFLENVKAQAGGTFEWGTLRGIVRGSSEGYIPIKNYNTNTWNIDKDRLNKYDGPYLREKYSIQRDSCWACSAHHCDVFKLSEGKYAGEIAEEPEYEQFAAFGPAIDQKDAATAVMLSKEVDRLGMDTNETGWLLGFVMECYEKGLLGKADLNGIEMSWGNGESSVLLLNLIARREGVGEILSEGVKRLSSRIGGDASRYGVYTLKGNTPRGHDHRTRWSEMFDTCVSNTGTIETTAPVTRADYSAEMALEVSSACAKTKGAMQLEDSAVTCRFNTRMNVQLLSEAIAAATGWDFTPEEGMNTGKRTVNLLRAFNLRNGLSSELDRPSARYGSTPADGPAAGKSILLFWPEMLRNYYELMGWDEEMGIPLPETLKALDLEYVAKDLW